MAAALMRMLSRLVDRCVDRGCLEGARTHGASHVVAVAFQAMPAVI